MARSRRKGSSGAALLVSLAVHGVVLILLARAIPIMPTIAPGRDVQVDLVSALPSTRYATPVSRAISAQSSSATSATTDLQSETQPSQRNVAHPRPAKASPQPRRPNAPVLPRAQPAPRANSRPTPATRPSPIPNRASATAGAATTAAQTSEQRGGSPNARASASAAQPGEDQAGGVRRFLRETVGCSVQDFAHLTVAERFECERQNGVQASIGAKQKLDALPANKRAYYDAVQQAYKAVHDYNGLGDMPGHGLNYSCVHGKCGLNLPQGAGAEESGVPPPQ